MKKEVLWNENVIKIGDANDTKIKKKDQIFSPSPSLFPAFFDFNMRQKYCFSLSARAGFFNAQKKKKVAFSRKITSSGHTDC